MRRWIFAFTGSLVFAFLFAPRSAIYAGTTGSLAGSVFDAAGIAVGSARITIVGPAQIENTTTDERGAFSFASLAP